MLRHIPRGRWPAFVVASMGRAGSTLVYDSLAAAASRKYLSPLGSRLAGSYKLSGSYKKCAWDLSATPLIDGVVHKTHDVPGNLRAKRPVKCVFTFCSASDSAISVYLRSQRRNGQRWIDAHFENLGADGPVEDLFRRDVLRLQRQIEAWSSAAHLDVLAMRYEAMWDHVDTLSAFVGFPVSLPPFRERRTRQADPQIVRLARALYGELDAVIAALPDVFRPPLQLASCRPPEERLTPKSENARHAARLQRDP